ncbi:MAG TPA: M3 family oligoendopeptidase [Candidatus Acidoferrales bacterium]|nr:M3 family oligoendopeptidase [Candidatus Acidoferrales bacterium]
MEKTIESADQIRWDLSVLYADIVDPRLDSDLAELTAMARRFSAAYKGKLPESLGGAIRDYSEIEMLSGKINSYLFLRESTDLTNAAIKAKHAAFQRELSAISGEHLTFFELELVQLSDEALKTFYDSDPVVAKHRPWIEHIRTFKRHFLSEPVESALVKRSPFNSGSWADFFDEVEADLDFEFRGSTKNLTEMMHLITDSKDAVERAEALKCVNDGLKGPFAKYSAQTLYMVAGLKAVEDKERGYAHPMDLRNKSNRIPDSVVDVLHHAVTTLGGTLTRRYYKLKARHLGLSVLRWSDRNAPMPFADTTVIPFDEAASIVKSSYQSFSPTLTALVKTFFDERRIDVPVVKEKRSGAFNSSHVLPGGKPVSFTLMNYLGSNRDVMTLAHELGHGVHGILAGEAQGPLMFHAPIAYCETASVFGEMTTFTFLKERLVRAGDRQSLLALIMAKIDSTINTVVRQIGFSNFERRLHGMDETYTTWSEPAKRSVEELDAIWLKTAQELYGKEGDIFTYQNSEHLWAYIPHFHSPFYVYGYAFGELLTQSLFAQRQRLGAKFEPLYLELLRSGSTKDVVELLAPFGLDARNEAFWKDGISVSLGALIEEAEQLSRGMGVI